MPAAAPGEAYSTTYFGKAATHFIDTAPKNKPVFAYYAPYAPHLPSFPQRRYANRFAHLPQYRPPSYNEANVSDKPPWIRELPRFDPVQGEQIYAERQAEYQTLLTVDNEVGAIVASLRGDAPPRPQRDPVRVRQRRQLGRAPPVRGQQAGAIRRGAARTAGRALRAGHERADDRQPPDREHRLGAHSGAIAGAPHPATEGRSFLRCSGSAQPEPPWRTQFLLEHMDGNPPSLAPAFCGIRSTRYMYARYTGGYQELYDLKKDPFELQNVASDPAEAGVIARMRALLAASAGRRRPAIRPRRPRVYVQTIPRRLSPCVQAVNKLRRYHQLFYQSGYAACKKT